MENIANLGQLMFGGFFVFMGLSHFMKVKALTAYAASKDIPQPRNAVLVGGFLLLFGGFSIIFGANLTWGILGLSLFLLVTSYKMHNFWALDDPAEKEMEMVNFLKNMALMGGALMLL